MASSFSCYVKDRRQESERESETSQLEQRARILSMLADIRRQISEVNAKLSALIDGEAAIERAIFEEDLALLMQERTKLVKQLQSSE
ncbi:hypothetical protein GN244_ATG18083 [Phytophthora infestans]|nr:hypothetical protein GN244_ATG18083 [Phytophthora infestans]